MTDDDLFNEIMADVELNEDEGIDYTKLDKLELLRLRAQLEEELKELQEVRFPRSDRGRELHSQLTAVYSAIRRK